MFLSACESNITNRERGFSKYASTDTHSDKSCRTVSTSISSKIYQHGRSGVKSRLTIIIHSIGVSLIFTGCYKYLRVYFRYIV